MKKLKFEQDEFVIIDYTQYVTDLTSVVKQQQHTWTVNNMLVN